MGYIFHNVVCIQGPVMVHLRYLMAKVRYCICFVHVKSQIIYNNKPKLSFIGMIIEGTV